MSSAPNLPAPLATLQVRDKHFEFWLAEGTAAGENAWSETRISSSRNAYGQVASVNSRNVTRREFWVRFADGKERQLGLPDNAQFGVREGQPLSLICMKCLQVDRERFYYMAVINHAADQWIQLDQQQLMLRLAGISPRAGRQALGNMLVVATLGLALIPLLIYANSSRHRVFPEQLGQHVRKIAAWRFSLASGS